MTRGVALLAVAVALLAAPPAAAGGWEARREAAVRFVEGRQGSVSFAVVDDAGRLLGLRSRRVRQPASVIKAMLLVAYLDMRSVRTRPLTGEERGVLGPMIRRSDDAAAETIVRRVRGWRLTRLARRAHMLDFRFKPAWGHSETSARDQARFFHRIDRYVVRRHRAYALRLLRTIVPAQRWGIPRELPGGWTIYFKGGWRDASGRITNQVALLRDGPRRLAIAVLSEWNPSHEYGIRTIRGIAARFLRTPLPAPPE